MPTLAVLILFLLISASCNGQKVVFKEKHLNLTLYEKGKWTHVANTMNREKSKLYSRRAF